MNARISLLMLIVTFLAVPTTAQGAIEYGSVEELKGVTTFYVDAGEDLDLRNIIKAKLEKSSYVVVDRPEDAEHVILFRWSDGGAVWLCRAVVGKRITSDRLRILANYRGKEADLDDLVSDYAVWLERKLRELAARKSAN